VLGAGSILLADRLTDFINQSRFRMTPGLLGKLSGLPKATLVNWLDGRVTRPRRWQDVVRVADALRLPECSASELLEAAGHPSVSELLALEHPPEDERLLAAWMADTRKPAALRRGLPGTGLLVGRETISREVERLLTVSGRRFVTITGMPGVGKTHLAIDVARSIAHNFHCEPVWIPLAPLRVTTRLSSALASALLSSVRGEADLVAFLAREFADKSILLVVDNAEHVTGAASTTIDILEAAPGVSVLFTSRVPLRCAGETEVRVPPLAVPEMSELRDCDALRNNPAVRMFFSQENDFEVKIAADEDICAIGKVVRQLDGIPLALTLAAAQRHLFTPLALANNLAHRFAILSSERLGVDGRRQTLRSAIDWSYALLRSDERSRFERCAFFESGWTAQSAEAVTGAPGASPWHILNALTNLMEHGFIVAEIGVDGEPRFRMLDTMREYALEKMHASPVDRLRTELAFVRYFAELVRGASLACELGTKPWPTELFRREGPNVKAALEVAIDRGESEDALTIATAWSIWETQSELERGRQLARDALELEGGPRNEDVLRLRARVHRTVGILALGCRDFEEARKALEAARELLRDLGDLRGKAIAECDLAYLSHRAGDDEACGSYANVALAYFTGLRPAPSRELGWVYAYLALADYDATDSQSDALCEVALARANEAHEERLLAFIYHFQGLLAFRKRDLAKAENRFRESIVATSASETSTAYGSLAGLGIVAAAAGHHYQAVSFIVAAERGLACVPESGTTLRQLKIASDASLEAISGVVGADVVEAWSKAARALDFRATLQRERHGNASA
jgi:predicted ATPase